VAAYQTCVDAGVCRAIPKKRGPKACNSVVPGRDQFPVNCVSYAEASAYCAWNGQRLPTEAEWELAARGRVGNTYPWGDGPPTCDLGVIDECKHKSMLPVASRRKGDTATGISDLSGNAFEWVADWYASSRKVSARPLKNPRGPCDGKTRCKGKSYRVIKGGHYGASRALLAGWARYFLAPSASYPFVGFRCAKAADPDAATAP
jgi:sulfatase modifying factor 1